MTVLVVVLAAGFVLGLVSYLIVAMELDRVTAQRDAAVAERADLDAVLRMMLAERPPATVLPLRRIPGQRNGDAS